MMHKYKWRAEPHGEYRTAVMICTGEELDSETSKQARYAWNRVTCPDCLKSAPPPAPVPRPIGHVVEC